MYSFSNKTVWITGATSGIGQELAIQLHSEGAQLILSGRNAEKLAQLKDQLSGAKILAFDLADPESIGSACATLDSQGTNVDVLINNGGISHRDYALQTTMAVHRQLMQVDYFSQIQLAQWAAKKMVAKKSGRIVNMASMTGLIGSQQRSAYSAAKHALVGYCDCLRAEIDTLGVKVQTVFPSYVKTAISHNAITGKGEAYGRGDAEIDGGFQLQFFVSHLLDQVRKGKEDIVIAKGKPLWGWRLYRLSQNAYHKAVRKFYRRTSESS